MLRLYGGDCWRKGTGHKVPPACSHADKNACSLNGRDDVTNEIAINQELLSGEQLPAAAAKTCTETQVLVSY